eukprot:1160230-Pelagomonas_calceolata.AAC.3
MQQQQQQQQQQLQHAYTCPQACRDMHAPTVCMQHATGGGVGAAAVATEGAAGTESMVFPHARPDRALGCRLTTINQIIPLGSLGHAAHAHQGCEGLLGFLSNRRCTSCLHGRGCLAGASGPNPESCSSVVCMMRAERLPPATALWPAATAGLHRNRNENLLLDGFLHQRLR